LFIWTQEQLGGAVTLGGTVQGGSKINILNEKITPNFKLLRQIKVFFLVSSQFLSAAAIAPGINIP
jgi:hypothetical protein